MYFNLHGPYKKAHAQAKKESESLALNGTIFVFPEPSTNGPASVTVPPSHRDRMVRIQIDV
jgi:hypothetical protein